MKRIYIILLILSLAAISGCTRKYESVFDESSSERVQNLMLTTLNTLTSSPEGWYIEHYQGWDVEAELGGYWFWCNFDADNQMSAAFELPVGDTYPVGAEYASEYQIVRGSGAELIFDTYNKIIQYFVEPGPNHGMAYQGDITFQVHQVSPDYIKMQGRRTKKFIHFHRKTDGLSVTEGLTRLGNWGKKITDATAISVLIDGVESTSVPNPNRPNNPDIFPRIKFAPAYGAGLKSMKSRVLVLEYRTEKLDENGNFQDDEQGQTIMETKTVRMPFAPIVDESGVGTSIKLYEPVFVYGQRIASFDYLGQGRFVSDDGYSMTLTFTGLQ